MGKSARYCLTICKNELKIIIILSFASLILCGCIAERNVQDNKFYSSSPKMEIIVNMEFNYLGPGSYYETTYRTNDRDNPDKKGEARVDFYFFAPRDDKKENIKKGVIISIHKKNVGTPTWTNPMVDRSLENVLYHGMNLLGEEYYEFAIRRNNPKKDSSINEWLKGRNYKLPVCVIEKIFTLKVDAITKKQILYFEDAELSGFDCKQWENMKQLSSKQLKFIDGFDQRASKAIQINSIVKD
jgi:hypothetical protein